MEAHAPSNGTAARLDELTRRANVADERAESQWRSIASTDRAVAVNESRVAGVESDISEIRKLVGDMRDEFRASKRWLATAAIAFAGLALTAAGLIVTVASGG